MAKIKSKIAFVAILFIFVFGLILPAKADILFNPSFIITDDQLTDFDSLTLAEIQAFLERKNSTLATKRFADYDGVERTAAEIIYNAATENRISPKVLLVTLQKEQSLISDPIPTENQYNKAMGYRCPDNALCHLAALGFGKQVDGAAWQFRQYLERANEWNFKRGQPYDIDGYTVIPTTNATAGLYNYTPHYHGNLRFWQIWQSYWGKNYPDGSLVKADGDPGVWLIEYGMRRLINSYSILLSRFDPKKILPIAKTDLEKYEIGLEIKFHNYSLLRSPGGSIYLLVDDELRHIASPEVFKTVGFNWEEVVTVNDKDIESFNQGQPLTLESVYPTGALIQDNLTNGVYFVESGKKHPIYSPEILKANFGSKLITKASPDQLQKYPTGNPVKFRDGELIKDRQQNEVYVIADGNRRWVTSEEAFAKIGYKWNNIIETDAKSVELHPLGQPIE